MTTYICVDGDVLDRVVWTHYGRHDNGLVEQVLAANPALAYSHVYEAGTQIVLPDLDPIPQDTQIKLWD